MANSWKSCLKVDLCVRCLPTCRSRADSIVWSRGWSRCVPGARHKHCIGGSVRDTTHPQLAWCTGRRLAGSTHRTGPSTPCHPHAPRPLPRPCSKQEQLAQVSYCHGDGCVLVYTDRRFRGVSNIRAVALDLALSGTTWAPFYLMTKVE
jgi:hypothetical protein